MATQQVAIRGLSRRWVGAILGRGLLVGVVHPTIAMLVGVLLGEQGTHFWFGFVVFGVGIAAVLSTAFAILTLPVALHVALAVDLDSGQPLRHNAAWRSCRIR